MYAKIADKLLSHDGPAVEPIGSGMAYSYRQLGHMVGKLADDLQALAKAQDKSRLQVGLFMKNSVEWIACDLALLFGGHLEIPVPLGFTAEQARSMLGEADCCLVTPDLIDAPEIAWLPRERLVVVDRHALLSELDDKHAERWLGEHAPWRHSTDPSSQQTPVKAVHTSGTTGAPKGVLITRSALESKLSSLEAVVATHHAARYASVVPMSLLIEQLSAIYIPLAMGGTVAVLPAHEEALTGGGMSASYYLTYLKQARPTFLTVPPSIVHAFADLAQKAGLRGAALCQAVFGTDAPPLIACGGAKTHVSALQMLASIGLPVYEGYGLSEYTAVVAWNTPTNYKLGTVGKALPGCEVKLAPDGELLIRGPSLFAGYLGKDPGACGLDLEGFLHTGDIAELDDAGYLSIIGRKKNIIINSSARKISAEWLESALSGRPGIREAFIFGDGRSFPVALVFAASLPADEATIVSSIAEANRGLPDYARVRNFYTIEQSDDVLKKYLTITGRPRRQQAQQDLCPDLDTLFDSAHPLL